MPFANRKSACLECRSLFQSELEARHDRLCKFEFLPDLRLGQIELNLMVACESVLDFGAVRCEMFWIGAEIEIKLTLVSMVSILER